VEEGRTGLDHLEQQLTVTFRFRLSEQLASLSERVEFFAKLRHRRGIKTAPLDRAVLELTADERLDERGRSDVEARRLRFDACGNLLGKPDRVCMSRFGHVTEPPRLQAAVNRLFALQNQGLGRPLSSALNSLSASRILLLAQ
jgi:hypothetical protein